MIIQKKLRDEWERNFGWYQYHSYLLKGNDSLQQLLQDKTVYLSFISELELIGFRQLRSDEEKQIQSLLDSCIIIPLNKDIKKHYVSLRRISALKLADAIIAATALSASLPLISADKQFKSVTSLNLIAFEV